LTGNRKAHTKKKNRPKTQKRVVGANRIQKKIGGTVQGGVKKHQAEYLFPKLKRTGGRRKENAKKDNFYRKKNLAIAGRGVV